MKTLNKVCTALTIVFAVFLAVLVAEIVYVLWRGRRFRRRQFASGDVQFSSESLYPTPSKELLYFFCWKNQTTRIEPDEETSATASAAAPPLQPPPTESELDEIMKRHALYGPSRILFTIKEEEREEMEMYLSSAEREEKRKTRGVSLEEVALAVAAVVIDVDDSTPFSTPCASPPYYTPSPSPPRDRILPPSSIAHDVVLQGEQREAKEINDDDVTVSLDGIEVHAS